MQLKQHFLSLLGKTGHNKSKMPLNRSHSPLQKFSSGLLAHITILWAGEYERLGTPAAISADRDTSLSWWYLQGRIE